MRPPANVGQVQIWPGGFPGAGPALVATASGIELDRHWGQYGQVEESSKRNKVTLVIEREFLFDFFVTFCGDGIVCELGHGILNPVTISFFRFISFRIAIP